MSYFIFHCSRGSFCYRCDLPYQMLSPRNVYPVLNYLTCSETYSRVFSNSVQLLHFDQGYKVPKKIDELLLYSRALSILISLGFSFPQKVEKSSTFSVASLFCFMKYTLANFVKSSVKEIM